MAPDHERSRPGAGRGPLAEALRLIVLTDRGLAAPRDLLEVVEEALIAGAPSIQLRDKGSTAREVLALGRELRERTAAHGALLWVNDRADIAEAVGADGVHVGPDDLPVSAIRRVYGDGLWIGASTDEPDRARQLVDEGADYLGCGAVYGTASKDVGDEAIGLGRLRAVVDAVPVPVVGVGGVTPELAGDVRSTGAVGVAVIGAVMAAPEIPVAVRLLLGR